MTLKQQLQEDIKKFGELAYLMWTYLYFEEWISCHDNRDIKEPHKRQYLRRKQSAALPFDLAAARARDSVEWLVRGKWHDAGHLANFKMWGDEIEFVCPDGTNRRLSFAHLRMKHPRRVGVDYLQLEDKT